MGASAVAYWFARVALAAAGLLVLLAAAVGFLMPPEVWEEGAPMPPASERLPGLAAGAGAAALLLLPHRASLRPRLFWPRLAVTSSLGLYLVGVGAWGVAAGLRGGRDPLIYPFSAGAALVGFAAPLCLWWRRRTRWRAP